jgi:hypothetical protein
MRRSPDSKEILAAIRSLAGELGRAPTRAEFTRRSGISHFKVLAHFPSLREAIRQAGLKPNPQGLRIGSQALLGDWGAVARKLCCLPSRSQYLRHGRYSAGVFTLRFGSWNAVPQSFVRFVRDAGLEEEWKDVLGLVSGNSLPQIDADERRSMQRAAPVRLTAANGSLAIGSPRQERPNLPPPLADQRCVTQVVLAWIVNTFASLNEAEAAVFPQLPNYQLTQLPILRNRRILGGPLSLPGLAYEPVNETGVVFLFGMMAHRLGFRVESLQSAFPDCEATRQIQPGKWQRVRVEFEYESRNFQTHRHPVEECDVIVCWRHNWLECPERLDVVEMRNVVANF